MPKFSEIPKFVLLDFFSSLSPSTSSSGELEAGLEIPGKHFVTEGWGYFYGIVKAEDANGNVVYTEIPFAPYGTSDTYFNGENYIFLERQTSLETSATSAITIPAETDFYLLRRKGGVVHQYLTNLVESGPQNFVNTIHMGYFVNINKPRLFIGKFYDQGSNVYMIDYWGFDRYATNALPEHNQTTKLKEYFKCAFDQVYNSVYNQARSIPTLLDPKEVNLDYILHIAGIYNVELDKDYYESLFTDRFDPVTRQKERRFRGIVANIINYLKRKGTYSSLFATYKALFNPTDDNLEVYERWHEDDLFDMSLSAMSASPFDLEPYMVDFNYLQYYGVAQSGCTSAGYYDTLTAKGIPTSLTNCYVYRTTSEATKWFVQHNLYTQVPIIRCFNSDLKQLSPARIEVINENFLVLEFWEPVSGYALLVKPEIAYSVGSPVHYFGFEHGLETPAPLFQGYEDATYGISSTTVATSAKFDFDTVSPSGINRLYVSAGLVTAEDTHVAAVSGDYLHEQYQPSGSWFIEHNLDSKAIVADFYASDPASAWVVTHGLDTKDLIVQAFDLESQSLYPTNIRFASDDIIKLTFETEVGGTLRMVRAEDTITLPTSSGWLVDHSTGVYVPIVQAFDSNYNVIPFTAEEITVEPRSDMSTLYVSAASPMDGYLHTATPGHVHTQYFGWDVWNVPHRLGTQNLLVTVYQTIPKYQFTLWHGFGDQNILVQFFNDQGIWVEPDTLSVSADVIYVEFERPFKGYVCIAEAEVTFTASTPSASWFIEHGLDILNPYNVMMQIQSPGTTSRDVYLEAPMLVIPTYDNENIFYTTPTSSFTWGEGYGQIARGNFIDYKSEPNNIWWVEHYLDTRELLVSTYTPQLTGSYFVIEHPPAKMASQIYNVYDRRLLTFERITQQEDYRTLVQMDTPPMTGYMICQAEADQVFVYPSGSDYLINHGTGDRYGIIQVFSDENVLQQSTQITLVSDNTALVSPSAAGNNYVVFVEPDYIESLQVVTENPLTVTHNLDKPGAVVQVYDDLYDVVSVSAHLTDENTVDLYFDTLPVTAAVVIKGVIPPVYAIKPDLIQHHSDDFFKIEFRHDFIGYTVARVADKAFMAVMATSAQVSFVDDYNLQVEFPASAAGYVSIIEADAMSTNMVLTSASDFYPIDENTAKAIFSEEKAGLAVIKEVGQLTYAGSLIMSPHYKAEVDLSCEPLTSPDILNEDYARMLHDQWELAKPVSKFAHYHLLLAIRTGFEGGVTKLYPTAGEGEPNVYTRCAVDASATTVSGGYVYSQGTADDYWEIQHDLGTENIIAQCYDVDRKLILAKSLTIVDENNILVQFHEPVAGICFIITAQDQLTFTQEASGTWAWLYTTEPSATDVVITDHYFYKDKEQILPFEIQVQETGLLEETWYVPTMGYAKLRKGDYLHVQDTASYEWVIDHTLDHRGVIVKLYDDDLKEILAHEIRLHKDQNRVTVTFPSDLFHNPQSGFAVITEVGGLYTAAGLIAAIADGGYVKIGNGTSTADHDPVAHNDLQSPVGPAHRYSPDESEDTTKYYLKAKSIGDRENVSVTEFGLFSKDDDLIFYSYVAGGQLYKHEDFDFTLFYMIDK